MSFAAPGWLGAGALVAGLLLLLHVLRPRPREVKVSSLLLWRLAFVELAATERKRRFLANLLLLLQLLTVLGLAVALAAPAAREGRLPLHLAIVVDTSASMGVAGEGGTTRIEAAANRLEALLASGSAERYTLLGSWGGAPLYEGDSKEELLSAVRSLPQPAGASDWEASLGALQSALAGSLQAAVLLVSDGALTGSSLRAIEAFGPDVSRFALTVGEPVGNLGITAFRARPVGGDSFRHEALIRVTNFSSQPEAARLRVLAGRPGRPAAALLLDETLELPAHEGVELLIEHTFAPGESLSAFLDPGDAFPLDDEAHLTAALPRAIRLLMVGVDDHFLREGFSVFPQVRLEYLPELPPNGAGEYDLVVFVDHPVPDPFEGTAVQFVTVPSGAGVPLQITSWNRAHPLSRFVEWGSIALAGGAPLETTGGDRPLVNSSHGPLVTVSEGERLRLVRVGVPLHGSDFPFRVAFPVFLYNLLQWAAPDEVRLVADALPPGGVPQALRRLLPSEGVSVAREGGEERELLREGSAFQRSLALPGVYTWSAGNERGRFAVSLVDSEESNLIPRWDEAFDRLGIAPLESGQELWSAPPTKEASAAERPRWRWFAALALVALAAEGFLATRSFGARAKGVGA